jgi:hypothetical protein
MRPKKKTTDVQTESQSQGDDLAVKLREAADHLESQPQEQRALGDGRLLRRLLEILLGELMGR